MVVTLSSGVWNPIGEALASRYRCSRSKSLEAAGSTWLRLKQTSAFTVYLATTTIRKSNGSTLWDNTCFIESFSKSRIRSRSFMRRWIAETSSRLTHKTMEHHKTTIQIIAANNKSKISCKINFKDRKSRRKRPTDLWKIAWCNVRLVFKIKVFQSCIC